ncbi:MAG: D-tyrosyl-tRNA(Tyr) deacylase [Planctomycetota bacterium]|jgi:D-tyrosyl-tRNA(Tyr) deacylase
MKAVVQRVTRAEVRVDGESIGKIDAGALVLLGVMQGDAREQAIRLAERIARLRFFADEHGRMNLSALDLGRSILVVSQFTLAADCRKGRRPSFTTAAAPELAEPLYESFCDCLENLGLTVKHGIFGAMMAVELVNDGPVTLQIEEVAAPDPSSVV